MNHRGTVRVPFRLVDVFTDRPLSGNQLCVCPDPVEVSEERMLELAREIGFSETTFVTEASGDRYRMRIFTPDGELPFAGHPTLGTAFVLVREGRVRSPATQLVTAGAFRVEVDPDRGWASMRQQPPSFGPEVPDRDRVAGALALTPDDLHPTLPAQVVSTGLAHLIVPLASPQAVARAERRPGELARLLDGCGADGLYLFAVTEEGARARLFDASDVVGEDAATGSAAGALGAYLAEVGHPRLPGVVVVRQGEEMGRPSELHVRVGRDGRGWSVDVAGGVVVVGRGAFELPS